MKTSILFIVGVTIFSTKAVCQLNTHFDNKDSLIKHSRLIFIATCFKEQEVSAFRYSAFNVRGDYNMDGDTISSVLIDSFKTAKDVIDTIRNQINLIKSIDFFTHSRTDRIAGLDIHNKDTLLASLFMNKVAIKNYKGNLKPSMKIRSLENIDFNKLSIDVIIELHGCNTGKEADSLPINFCKEFSKILYDNGKKFAIVIGHGTKSNPNINGENSTEFLDQDYRHGLRVIYYNGSELFRTTQQGKIPQILILSKVFDKMNRNQSNHN